MCWESSFFDGCGFDVIRASHASDHVKNRTNCEDSSNNIADPDVNLGEGERSAENIEERLDPEGVDKGAVLVNVADLKDDANEEQTEESIVACYDITINAHLVILDRQDGVKDCKSAESDSYSNDTRVRRKF